jgi:2'-hydroxyisoflavone reductase
MPSSITRRSFLASSLATGSAAAAASALPLARPYHHRPAGTAAKKKILVLGGTIFLGPAIVEAGKRRGHEFTLFNRGRSNPELFKDVEQLRGQRRRPDAKNPKAQPQDLEALKGRKWDAVIDTSGYFTGEVEDVAKILAGNVGQYVYVSSISVYKSLEKDNTPVDEQSALCECADKYTFDMGKEYENYGALKRYCEEAASAVFGDKALLVRPGYIVGPGDTSDRFTYWPQRFLRGGECLAPGAMDNDLQFIDVRDLGEWIVQGVEDELGGAFNAVGFGGRISTAEFLYTGKGTVNDRCTFTWVDDAFLEANGVSPWGEMGCWTPAAKNARAKNEKSIAAGAKYRPIADTIRDTAAWVQNGRGERPWAAGMKAEREAELLAKWKAAKR